MGIKNSKYGITVIRNDITEVDAEVIVNSANPNFTIGPGIDSAICRKAGADKILSERKDSFRGMEPGRLGITGGYDLKAQFIFHVCGPKKDASPEEKEEVLRTCYKKCIQTASQKSFKSIAIPVLGAGHLGVDEKLSFDIAVEESEAFFKRGKMLKDEGKTIGKMSILLVIMGDELTKYAEESGFKVRKELNEEAERSLKEKEELMVRWDMPWPEEAKDVERSAAKINMETESRGKHNKESFLDKLEELMSKHKLDNCSDIDRAANFNQGRMNNILRGTNSNTPLRNTVISICFGMKLNLEDSVCLLERAGYALDSSGGSEFDRIVADGIMKHLSIDDVNQNLYDAGFENVLGSGTRDKEKQGKTGKENADER